MTLPPDHPPVAAPRIGVLLVNLGTPDAPDASSVRRYLAQFLSDRRVVEIPQILWQPILRGIILTTRPKKSAHAYAQVWTDEGSPLAAITRAQSEALQTALGDAAVVAHAMRYGQPAIGPAIDALMATARQSERGLQVEQLVAVVDAGRLVNPSIARQQIEGGLIFGLAAAVGATTDYEGGIATARKLGQLGLPDLSQTPQILVEFVESDRDPGGLGEIGVPVVAPAIANAMFAATGRRIRRIPLSAHPL